MATLRMIHALFNLSKYQLPSIVSSEKLRNYDRKCSWQFFKLPIVLRQEKGLKTDYDKNVYDATFVAKRIYNWNIIAEHFTPIQVI